MITSLQTVLQTVESLRRFQTSTDVIIHQSEEHQRSLQRYENKASSVPRELHVFRIGGAAFATNTFELYLDYGDRIKGASKAEQTFLIQLCNAPASTYLPSRRSGTTGYGSTPASCSVTPEAGDMIVNESIKEINKMFETK